MTTTTKAAAGQVSRSAADIYEDFFVPALFGEWAEPVIEAADVAPGDRILDVACGTGVVARAAAARVGQTGRVTALDRNPGMLAATRRLVPGIDWQEGMAEVLPFPDASFDAVICQFGLMFFEDRSKALAEMWRVLRPGGRLAVAVWDRAENSPGYAAMIGLLDRLFGPEHADALRAPFLLGDREELKALFGSAGISSTEINTRCGKARFDSIDAWVTTDVKGWTLAEMIDDEGFAKLRSAAAEELAGFAGPDGRVVFDVPGHIANAVKT